jgi:hypothetical protein
MWAEPGYPIRLPFCLGGSPFLLLPAFVVHENLFSSDDGAVHDVWRDLQGVREPRECVSALPAGEVPVAQGMNPTGRPERISIAEAVPQRFLVETKGNQAALD